MIEGKGARTGVRAPCLKGVHSWAPQKKRLPAMDSRFLY